MKYAVCDILFNGDAALNRHGIPKSTLKDHAVKFDSVVNQINIPFSAVTREHYFGAISKRPPPLLTMDDVTFLLKTTVYCDNNNNRMGRDDIIYLVMDMSQNNNQKKCEDHYDYLVHRKKLDGVKRDGVVVTA